MTRIFDERDLLAKHSDLAKTFINYLVEYENGFKYNDYRLQYSGDIDIYDNLAKFHPNGKSGCIELEEGQRAYGMYCDRIIWLEGYNERDGAPEILLIGNEKGSTVFSYIKYVFSDR